MISWTVYCQTLGFSRCCCSMLLLQAPRMSQGWECTLEGTECEICPRKRRKRFSRGLKLKPVMEGWVWAKIDGNREIAQTVDEEKKRTRREKMRVGEKKPRPLKRPDATTNVLQPNLCIFFFSRHLVCFLLLLFFF